MNAKPIVIIYNQNDLRSIGASKKIKNELEIKGEKVYLIPVSRYQHIERYVDTPDFAIFIERSVIKDIGDSEAIVEYLKQYTTNIVIGTANI